MQKAQGCAALGGHVTTPPFYPPKTQGAWPGPAWPGCPWIGTKALNLGGRATIGRRAVDTVAEVKLLQRGGAAKDAESCIRHFSASMVLDTYGVTCPRGISVLPGRG